MRLTLLLCLLSNIALANTANPRETFQTFLKAMVEVKETQNDTAYKRAISTLDINQNSFTLGRKYSDDLVNILDRIKKVNYESIPKNPTDPYWIFDKRIYQGKVLEISVIKKQDKWLFSQQTLDSIEDYKLALKNNKLVSGVKKLTRLQDKIQENLPASLQGKLGPFQTWQLVGLLLILFIAFVIEKIVGALIAFVVRYYSKVAQSEEPGRLKNTIKPLSKIVFVFICLKSIIYLDLSASMLVLTERVLLIIMSFMAVWFGHKVVVLLSHYATLKAETTEAKFDDILIPLITKTAFVVVYIIGALIVANAFTINVTGLIAGLGIGGLAFAFAAKDTLANFFGSIMLVLDRPFDIGDIISTGDISGVVTEVGFRSTRIRTFNDSLITISNGELVNRAIDNQGKRRFRRLHTSLGVQYDTPPGKIEAFCEGIRQLILNHRWTRKDSFHVYFEHFGASSLDIKVIVYWETDDYARELAEKHRLNIDILRLAKELGIEFAFPTQTVHMFNETATDQIDIPDKHFEVAIEKAKEVATKPLSLKNPRSNAEDQDQFGNNDIGN